MHNKRKYMKQKIDTKLFHDIYIVCILVGGFVFMKSGK